MIRRYLCTAAIIAVATLALAQVQTPVRTGDLVIQGGWLFDSIRDDARRNSGIVVRNGSIVEVDADLSARELSAARVVRLSDDEYLMPGLIDLHAHYAADLFGAAGGAEYTVHPWRFPATEVTWTFPAVEVVPNGLRGVRNRIVGGEQIGCRMRNSDPYFGRAGPGWVTGAVTRIRCAPTFAPGP